MAAFGARELKTRVISGIVQVHAYVHPASDGTALYKGDFVKLTAGASVDEDGNVYPEAIRAAAGDALRGFIVAVRHNPNDLSIHYCPASVLRTLYVNDDPSAEFIIMEDSVGGNLAITTCIGQKADIIVASGSTVTNLSGTMLDSSTASGSTAQLEILNVWTQADGTTTGTNALWVCKINEYA